MAGNLPNSPGVSSSDVELGKRVRNFLIVLAAMTLSVFLFLGLRSQANNADLTTLAQESIPLEVAMTNSKPTLMEFYANWCTTCQAMAKNMKELKQEYGEKVNFVMLNVDNIKWLPEISKYRVDGIPHFVFFNKDGTEISHIIGEIPRPIMVTDLESLIAENPIPSQENIGQVSKFVPKVKAAKDNTTDPRSHGAQVQ